MKIKVVFLTAISTLDDSYAKNQEVPVEHQLVGAWVKTGVCRFADDTARADYEKATAPEPAAKTPTKATAHEPAAKTPTKSKKTETPDENLV